LAQVIFATDSLSQDTLLVQNCCEQKKQSPHH